MAESDIQSKIDITVGEDTYAACLKLATLKAIEAETGLGTLVLFDQCRTQISSLTHQAIIIGLALRAANPTWGLNKINKILDQLTVMEHLVYASSLLNLSVLRSSDKMRKEDEAEEEQEQEQEDEKQSPLH